MTRGKATAAILAANIGFVLIAVAAGWPQWWVHINYEKSALTWFSFTQLTVLGFTCLSAAWLSRGEARLLFGALGLAFGFLALDERLGLHEWMREKVFKPNEIGTHIPGVGAGDFLFLVYAPFGLAIAWRLWRHLRGDRATLAWLGFALAIAICAVLLDGLHLHGEGDVWAARRLQFAEEILETAGQTGFLCAFARHALRLREENGTRAA